MKRAFRILAGVIALVTIAVWLALGAHRGWTRTRVEVMTLDEFTGIEQRQWRDQFVPGVDFLGAGLIAAGALTGASILFRNPTKTKPTH